MINIKYRKCNYHQLCDFLGLILKFRLIFNNSISIKLWHLKELILWEKITLTCFFGGRNFKKTAIISNSYCLTISTITSKQSSLIAISVSLIQGMLLPIY